MRIDWQQLIGPSLTTALAASAAIVNSGPLTPLTIGPLLVVSAGVAAVIGGTGSGAVSAAIAVGLCAMTLPDTPDRLAHLITLAVAAGATAALAARLRVQMTNALSWQRRRHATAERLSAALDRIDLGVVLLGPDTRAEFINQAFRDYFRLPDDKAAAKPPFIALMYHGRDTGAFQLPDDEMADYIAARTELMRSGDPRPLNLRLSDGRVLRVSCAALPDGSRMMSYAPINDTLRRTDDPIHRETLLAMRRPRPAITHQNDGTMTQTAEQVFRADSTS
jgi:PAS domain-containing protein